MNSMESVKIRTLKKEDLDAIVEIDEKVLGENRKNYWERKLALMNYKSSLFTVRMFTFSMEFISSFTPLENPT